MNQAELRAARELLDLTQAELADRLQLGANGGRTVRRWELGERPIPGPVAVAIELMVASVRRRRS